MNPTLPSSVQAKGAFRSVPRTGVIFVTTEAARRGYRTGHPDWVNFGQGMPETGVLAGSPERIEQITIDVADQEYAPVGGIWELREAVADHYNRLYRRGMPSRYSAENVCISPGGRSALTRVAASLGGIHLGHFLPDYTAYEELLDIFRGFTPIPILLDPERGYEITLAELEREIMGRGLGALLLSNPCNPTGKVIQGDELRGWVSLGRRLDCALIFDEFYGHYVWTGHGANGQKPGMISAASYIEDVEKEAVVVVDGLTKNWRYPGWRIAWTLGPRAHIDAMMSAGSFLDGGAARPLQKAAITLLDERHTLAEVRAIHGSFLKKRALMLDGLKRLGLTVDAEPAGTFYVWADVSRLSEPFNTGMKFFTNVIEQQIICVPGEFFDVNPGKRRSPRASRFSHHVRFSFGPSQAEIERGLSRLNTALR